MTDYFGNNLDNTMVYTNNDRVWGYEGSDYLSAGNMYGGNGDDTYLVDHPSDLVVENAGEGRDKVISFLPDYTLTNNVENLNLSFWSFGGYTPSSQNGTGNSLDNVIQGNRANNMLRGEGGHDFLDSGAGSDTLRGGSGDDHLWGTSSLSMGTDEIDILWGGSGSDYFWLGSQALDNVFYATLGGVQERAEIKDFEIGVDKVVLHGSVDNYALGSNPYGSGIGIYYKTYYEGPVQELIGTMEGANVNLQTISLSNSNIFSIA